MMFAALTEAGGLLDESVVTFITNGMKSVIGIMTVQPLGTFITIGLVGAIVGLGVRLMQAVKNA